MRAIVLAAMVLVLSTTVQAEDPKAPDGAGKRPPPPPGIRWERDLEAGLQRAAREGRPVLFAVNALENERANNSLAADAYRSVQWGEATRGYVAFVCNPNDHAEGEGACTRYPGHTCAGHKAPLTWFLKKFGDELISPQHVILEPDGDVAYRKEYYTFVVSPTLLETYLSNLAPNVAYARAAIGREARVKRLGKVPPEELLKEAAGWLDSGDGLAAAGVVGALDECFDAKRRATLIEALGQTPTLQVPVVVMAAEERIYYPTDDPAETAHWLRALFAADRAAGVWGATRVLVRLESDAARTSVLRIWAGAKDEAVPGIDDLPEREQSAAYEALLLAGDRRADATRVPGAWTRGREEQIRRAQRVRGKATVSAVGLAAALEKAPPGRLRLLLLRAPPEEVRQNVAAVRRVLEKGRQHRVRVAAALALLRAQVADEEGRIVQTILTALADVIEGREARAMATAILGDDPGQAREVWEAALAGHLKGGAK